MTPSLVLVTDSSFGDDAVIRCTQKVARALPPGALCLHLRDKRRPIVSLRIFAGQLRRVTLDAGASLVINGHARLARDVGADGVHLGGGAGSVAAARSAVGRRTWVSVAAHSDEDVRVAVADGADAVLVGAIFPTRPSFAGDAGTEKVPRGLQALRSARALAGPHVRVFALGGVTPERARACAVAGAHGVAVIRALLASPAPGDAARAMHDALQI